MLFKFKDENTGMPVLEKALDHSFRMIHLKPSNLFWEKKISRFKGKRSKQCINALLLCVGK